MEEEFYEVSFLPDDVGEEGTEGEEFKKDRQSSTVWKEFRKVLNGSRALCKHCSDDSRSIMNANCATLKRHLLEFHFEVFETVKAADEAKRFCGDVTSVSSNVVDVKVNDALEWKKDAAKSSSTVWREFNPVKNGARGVCKHCTGNARVSFSALSHCFKRHLKQAHVNVFKAVQAADKAKKCKTNPGSEVSSESEMELADEEEEENEDNEEIGSRKKSAVWKEFTKIENSKKAFCKHCETLITANAYCLKRHIKSYHMKISKRIEAVDGKTPRRTRRPAGFEYQEQSDYSEASSAPNHSTPAAHLNISNRECFVCRQMFNSPDFNLIASSNYSKRTIQELFGEFTPEALVDSLAVCNKCKSETDAFDKFFSKAMAIKEKLLATKFAIAMPSHLEEQFTIENVQIKSEAEMGGDDMMVIKEVPLTIKTEFGEELEEAEEIEESAEEAEESGKLEEQQRSNCDSMEELDFDDFQPAPDPKKKRERPKNYKCSTCGKAFSSQWYVTAHEEIHLPELNYECSTCKKRFRTRVYFQNHLKLHDETIKFFCDFCGFQFKTKNLIRKHLLWHHSGSKRFLCSQCPKTFPYEAALRIHHLVTHTDERNETCKTCGLKFHTKHLLKRHERAHSIPTFKCSFCPKKFKRNDHRTAHVRNVHLKTSSRVKFDCSLCDRKFDRKRKMLQHLSTAHGVVGDELN